MKRQLRSATRSGDLIPKRLRKSWRLGAGEGPDLRRLVGGVGNQAPGGVWHIQPLLTDVDSGGRGRRRIGAVLQGLHQLPRPTPIRLLNASA